MATPFRLAVLGLALLHLLSTAAAEKNHLAMSSRAFVATIQTELPNDAAVTSADRATTTSTSATAPRRLDVLDVAGEEDGTTAPATTAPPPTCRCVCVVVHLHPREVAVDDIVPASSGITTTPATTTTKALLHALPLLAVPFLPPPLAALVVLSSLAPSARASGDTCPMVPRATCTVYRYLHDGTGTGCVDRSLPFDGVRPASCRQGQLDYPFLSYCRVRTLEFFNNPQGQLSFRFLDDHTPLADPDAVVAAGGDVCYVELAHASYRDGYFIRCPLLCCSNNPVDGERRKLPYRGAVVWDQYSNRTVIHAQA